MKMTWKECFGVISILFTFFMSGLGLSCAFPMLYTDVESPPIEAGARRILVTVAYLGEAGGYTQVYADEDTDFTIHMREEYVAEGPSLSNVVPLAGTIDTVSSVSWQEFSVVADDISKVVPEVSGELVYLNNVPIGFISGWDGRGSLRYIFYQGVPTWTSLFWSLPSQLC